MNHKKTSRQKRGISKSALARKAIGCILMCLILAVSLFPLTATAETKLPTRVIHVVYDDSGSMYIALDGSGRQLDTWCQAKYSMEVFAAMLGENDTMSVYYMSDYETGTSAPPRMTLRGSDGAAANVAKVHAQKTLSQNTPFNSVKKAQADLESVSADEKWLVVLTDGMFNDGAIPQNEVDAQFAKKSAGIKVMFLGMGPDAGGVTPDAGNNIFFEKAATSKDILNKITDISTRVFNSNRLELNRSQGFSFDVPMGELTVFAQGKDVSINGIKTKDGKTVSSSASPVSVKYSECDATNYNNAPSTDLVGSIVTYRGDFDIGEYQADVTGAETVEIYYKPNVDVILILTDADGNEVTDLSALAEGDYTVNFGFVKSGTKDRIGNSALLGDVRFSATVDNNGKRVEVKPGETLHLDEGNLIMDATAEYLDYNSVSTHSEYQIYKDKEITFTLLNTDKIFHITSDGIDNDEPLRVKATIDGQEFTAEQWNSMKIPTVEFPESEKRAFGAFRVEKSDEIGVFNLYPTAPEKWSGKEYDDTEFKIFYREKHDFEVWTGSDTLPLKLQDDRPWLEKNKDCVIRCVILLIIVIIIALIMYGLLHKTVPKYFYTGADAYQSKRRLFFGWNPITVSGVHYFNSEIFSGYPVVDKGNSGNRWIFSRLKRSEDATLDFAITELMVDSININGDTIKRTEVSEDHPKIIRISNGTTYSWNEKNGENSKKAKGTFSVNVGQE